MIGLRFVKAATGSVAAPLPLDQSAVRLIEKSYRAKGARPRGSSAAFVKALEARPASDRASILMGLAMANPIPPIA